jgi:hypothetical protein
MGNPSLPGSIPHRIPALQGGVLVDGMPISGRGPVKFAGVIAEKAAEKGRLRRFAVLCRIRERRMAVESASGLW